MGETDLDLKIADAIKTTNDELARARDVVADLASEIALAADQMEPALIDLIERLRRARMTSIDEMRQVTSHLREMRELFLSKEMEPMMAQAERFLRVCKELEEFRAVGFIDAFLAAFRAAPLL